MLRYEKAPDVRRFDVPKQNAGNKVRAKYKLDIAPDQSEKLVKVGDVVIQEEIQSHKEACDLKTILKRHEMAGTLSELEAAEGGVIDLTQFPTNLHEMRKVLNDADKLYYNLKPEIRAQFSDVSDFLSKFGNIQTLNAYAKAYAAPKEEKKEVKTDASDT